jgi:predicted  nucleic acid-binding Zn-ribbon protein
MSLTITPLPEATRVYHAAAAASVEQHLQPTLSSLLSRMNGIDASGNPLRDHDVPTQADFDALFAEDAKLSRPVEDEMLLVQFSDLGKDENREFRTKQVRWGETWKKFQGHYVQQRDELADLRGEMDEVEMEMKMLEKEVVEGDEEMRRAEEKFQEEMGVFKEKMEEVEREYRVDVLKAEKEEKDEVREFRRKFDEFLKNALGE